MNREEFEYFVPLLTEHFEAVIKRLDRQARSNARYVKAPRRAVLETYLSTRDVGATARHFGVSKTTIMNVLYKAVRNLREIAGIKPGGLPSDLVGFRDDSDGDDG